MTIQELYEIFRQHPVVTTDSRDCPRGSIFVALRGDRFDGNRYAAQAIEKGCSVAIVDEQEYACAPNTVLVPDSLDTLRALALTHRRVLGIPIVGITGTNGKTTTKELTAAVLSKRYRTMATEGNFNNEIGVPKTLLRLTPDSEIAVVEMGASHPGDIKRLVDIVEPDCGLITNVGRAHLEGFGSIEGVLHTKCELYDFLRSRAGSTVFLCSTNEMLAPEAHGFSVEKYGTSGHGLAVEGRVVACDPFLFFEFRTAGGEWHAVKTRLVGAYNIDNLLAAAAVGHHFGVADGLIAEAFEQYEPKNKRSQLVVTPSNRLIVDAYNANPSSMAAAIGNFRLIDAAEKLAILGEMRELGAESEAEHERVLRQAAVPPFARLWLVGRLWQAAVEAVFPGYDPNDEARAQESGGIRLFADVDEVKAEIARCRPCGQTILIKGSNSVRLSLLPETL